MDFTISKEGGELTNTQALAACIRSLPDGLYKISVKKWRKTRTSQQNKYLWGVAYPRLLEILRDRGGWEIADEDEVHGICKKMFLSKKVVNRYTGETIEFPSSSAIMDTVQFSTYVDQIVDFALYMFGEEIPLPEPNIYLPITHEDRKVEDAEWAEEAI